jgi:hypothetical protein
VNEYTDNRVQEDASPPSSRASSDNNDGDEDGNHTPDQRLVALAGKARRRTLTHSECQVFLEAVAEARLAGATNALIAHFVSKANNGEAVWIPVNTARDTSRTLLDSYQDVVQLGEPRTRLEQITADFTWSKNYLDEHPPPDEGRHHNQRVLDWAHGHSETLTAAGALQEQGQNHHQNGSGANT